MMGHRVLLVLVGLLLLWAGIAWLMAVPVTGPGSVEAPDGALGRGQELIRPGKALAGTVQATVTNESDGGSTDAQTGSGPRLYQMVVETVLTGYLDALSGTSGEAEGRSGEYQGGPGVLSRPMGSSPFELLVVAWALLGGAWLLHGVRKRLA